MKRSDIRHENNNAYLVIDRGNDAESDSHSRHYPIQNLSRGGIRFCSNEHFEIDERVNLLLYIDEKLSHQACGRICYHDEDQQHNNYYGISFLDKYLSL
ncbi:MAG: PilZ domain-containing protein [Gammaproteobacteria bacterium]|nr:PilZ domain-containing protein [Gammaproteobacteria bacterium]